MSSYHYHLALYSTPPRSPLILQTDVRLPLIEVIERVYHSLALGLGSDPLNNLVHLQKKIEEGRAVVVIKKF
jgi:hypothetical protein